jgi:hypothetical protein
LKKKLDKRKKVLKAKKASEPKSKDGETPEPSRDEEAMERTVTIAKPSSDNHTTTPSTGKVDGNTAVEGDEESEESLEVRRAKRKAEKKQKREERRALEKELAEQRAAMPIAVSTVSHGSSNSE